MINEGLDAGQYHITPPSIPALCTKTAPSYTDRVFPFDEAKVAYRNLEGGTHFGKIVIAVP